MKSNENNLHKKKDYQKPLYRIVKPVFTDTFTTTISATSPKIKLKK